MPISQAVVTSATRAAADAVDGAHEDLRRDVLGDGAVAAAGEQVAVDLADGVVVQGEERGTLVPGGDGRHGHDPPSSRPRQLRHLPPGTRLGTP